ncbi:MAG TPA: hypothetical protein GX523_03185 [Desulfitobacterium dehalogenans]|uniref:Uncharacterized protein n=1 Tax=Desulfitobacterium dehalogenans TaxID=36854 RepID=A0A7C7D469_9FIRM|nr:hypothetical protein [Desulfitobacterium dehalogenans]
MLFGKNNVANPPPLFDSFPIGTRLQIGVDAGYWIGDLAGIRYNSVIINKAQFFDNSGSPIEELRSTAQISLNLISFVSEAPENIPAKFHSKEIGDISVKEHRKLFFTKMSIIKSLDKSAGKLAEFIIRINESAQSLFNNVFGSNSSNLMQNAENENDNNNNTHD